MKSNTKTNTSRRSVFYSIITVLIVLVFILGCPRSSRPRKGKLGLWWQLNPNPSVAGPALGGCFDVTDVQIVDSNFIVAVGTNGMFLRTSNFGNTWLPCRTLHDRTMRAVHFINRDIGYAAGIPSQFDITTPGEGIKIYRTTNGGITWENVLGSLTGPEEIVYGEPVCAPGCKSRINDLYFTDENNGIAVGEHDYGEARFYTGLVLWTNDGGQTWSWNYSPGGLLNAIDFANADLGIAVGGILGAGGLFVQVHGVRTTQGITGQPETCDGSSSPLGWDDLESNIQTGLGGSNGTLTGISFLDETTAYVTGAVSASGVDYYGVFGTMDAGETWETMLTTEGTPILNADLYDISYPTSTGGTVVGSGGLILHNYSPPFNWDLQASNTNVDLTCVDFISPNRGVIGGQGSTILTTRNGGDSWEGPRSVTVQDLHAIEVLNNDFVAVCGDRGTIATSEDGGETWCFRCTETIRSIFDIAYASPTSGIAVGLHGYVVYTNSGQHWDIPESYPFSTAYTNENLHMNGVDFFTDTKAVAVGKNRLAITGDAGRTWTERSIPETENVYTHLMDVACLDANNAVAVGYNGVIIRTKDGGQTWTTVQTSISDHLCGVYFPDSQHGWAVGYDTGSTSDFNPSHSQEGIVMYTQDGGLTWTKQYRSPETVLIDVHFTDQNTGIAVGGTGSSQDSPPWGYILVTLNGGETWNIADLPKPENLQGVRTFPDGRVYVAGSHGFIARTDNLSEL